MQENMVDPIRAVLGLTKEVFETKNGPEAARMIQTGKWMIISGCIQGDEVLWILARYR